MNQFGKNIFINKKTIGPVSSTNRLLVEVYSAGINTHDLKIRNGLLQQVIPLRFPIILGIDFAGVVVHPGEGVQGFKAGDEVYGQSSLLNGWGGSYAEFISVDAQSLALKPRNMNYLEAAALPLPGLTAYRALIEHLQLKSGQKILIHGGAGNVGSIAIQLAKHLGAFVATTASGKNHRYLKNLGADVVIDYKKQFFEQMLQHYDAVLDTVGGETYTRSFKVLKKGGMIVSLLEKPIPNQMEELKLNAVYQTLQTSHHRLNEVAKLAEQGVIQIKIKKKFTIDRVAEALEYKQNKHPQGKIVLQIPRYLFMKNFKKRLKNITKR
jgi:NADPH:quinone reductase-like Zn-dependent oxidoreductase